MNGISVLSVGMYRESPGKDWDKGKEHGNYCSILELYGENGK